MIIPARSWDILLPYLQDANGFGFCFVVLGHIVELCLSFEKQFDFST